MKHRTTTTRFATALALAVALAGCQLPGLLINNLPQGRIPAAYEPPNRPTVVLVDDPGRVLPSMQFTGLIAGAVESELKRSEAITRFIPPHRVDTLRMNNNDFASWSIAHVGQRLGAEQVIHVRVGRFDLNSVPEMYRPIAAARVKVIDAETGRRMFPHPNRPPRNVAVKMAYRSRNNSDTPAARTVLARRLADRLGEEVANLFHDHEPNRVGSGYTE